MNGVEFACEDATGEYAEASFLTARLGPEGFEGKLPSLNEVDRADIEENCWGLASVGLLYGIDDKFFVRARRDVTDDWFFECVPTHILAIGDNDGGNRICISLAGTNYGAVYLWESPEISPADEGKPPSMDDFRWIAKDFRNFWDAVELITCEQADDLVG